jgi:hypothetical protein
LGQADQVLQRLNVASVSDTDLPDACGVALYPCVAQVGDCALSNIVSSHRGKLTAGTNTCNCFTLGYSESIAIPSNPYAVVSCPYSCIDALLKYTSLYLVSNNTFGEDLSKKCSVSLDILTTVEYGNKRGYVPTDSDTDALFMLPVNDPRVVQVSGGYQHLY